MTSKGIQTIIENHRNQTRINQLEALIPQQEKAFEEVNKTGDIARIAHLNLYIGQLKLEYKERSGNEYQKI